MLKFNLQVSKKYLDKVFAIKAYIEFFISSTSSFTINEHTATLLKELQPILGTDPNDQLGSWYIANKNILCIFVTYESIFLQFSKNPPPLIFIHMRYSKKDLLRFKERGISEAAKQEIKNLTI